MNARATSTCPACGADALVTSSPDSNGAICQRCGFAQGEDNRCPHCKVVARIEGSGMRARCASCGGPRIANNFGGAAAANALLEQQRALTTARLSSIATVIQAGFAAGITTVGILIHPASIVGMAVIFGFALIPLFLALRSRWKAAKARRQAEDASERAWQAAAEDLAARSSEGVTVESLAKSLGIAPEHAERLLTALTVHERTRIDVGDDASVRYSARPGDADGALALQPDAFSTDEEVASEAKKLEGVDRSR